MTPLIAVLGMILAGLIYWYTTHSKSPRTEPKQWFVTFEHMRGDERYVLITLFNDVEVAQRWIEFLERRHFPGLDYASVKLRPNVPYDETSVIFKHIWMEKLRHEAGYQCSSESCGGALHWDIPLVNAVASPRNVSHLNTRH